jgi:hypothetical protein
MTQNILFLSLACADTVCRLTPGSATRRASWSVMFVGTWLSVFSALVLSIRLLSIPHGFIFKCVSVVILQYVPHSLFCLFPTYFVIFIRSVSFYHRILDLPVGLVPL